MDEQDLAGGNIEIKNTPESPRKQNASMKRYVWLGVAVVVVGAIAGLGVYRVYAKTATDKFSLMVAKVLRLPAVKVGNETISYVNYSEDLKAIHIMRDYDKAQRGAGATPDRSPGADLTEEQMTDQVLWRLVNSLLVEGIAKKYAVTVEDADVQKLKTQMLQQFKDEAAANEELIKRYGWSMDVYEQKVMRPFILQTKLAQKFKEDTQLKEELRVKAQKVLQEIKNGADFAATAKKYSEDSSSEIGGDLGWFGKGQMVPEFEQAAFSLKKGEIYPALVETIYGYHIVKLDDKKIEKEKNSAGKLVGVEKASASHILFRFTDLAGYFDKMVKNTKIKLYLNIHNPFAEINEPPPPVPEEKK